METSYHNCCKGCLKETVGLFKLWNFYPPPFISYSNYSRVSSALVWNTASKFGEGWGWGFGFTNCLDRVESKVSSLVSCSVPSNSVDLFFNSYAITFTTLVLKGDAVSATEYCIDIGNSRLVHCGALFLATSVFKNCLSSSVFPTEFYLPHFKDVSMLGGEICDRWALYRFSFYFYHLIILHIPISSRFLSVCCVLITGGGEELSTTTL